MIDLEWNQCPVGGKEKDDFPFEIIEIGAVKLNEERQIIDEFHEVISPQVYLDLHPKTNEIIHIEKEELEKGNPFSEVMINFLKWCGKDFYFATWGTCDLFELQRNMEYYNMPPLENKPFFYYDVQKLFSLQTEGRKNAHSLEYAVDFWDIEKNESFHRALWDAEYTAKILKKIDIDMINSYFSIDYYHNPKVEEDEIYAVYENYSKYISKEFDNKENLMEDKKIKEISCFKCGKEATKRLRWFSNNLKNYYCLAYCSEHGYIKGRIRIHKTRQDKAFAVKIVSLITEEKANLLQERYQAVRIHKQKKRKSKNEINKESKEIL